MALPADVDGIVKALVQKNKALPADVAGVVKALVQRNKALPADVAGVVKALVDKRLLVFRERHISAVGRPVQEIFALIV